MKLHTCSEIISFVKELEGKSANFYKDLAQKYVGDEDLFLSFSKDNERNVKDIERAYYGVITDAIEACFAFDVETDEHKIEPTLMQNAKYCDLIKKAIEIEENIIKFYSEATKQSEGLMADVPRAFRMVAKKRGSRRPKLESLLQEES